MLNNLNIRNKEWLVTSLAETLALVRPGKWAAALLDNSTILPAIAPAGLPV